MTTKFRTLWLWGFIGLAASAAGCGPPPHGSRYSSGSSGAGSGGCSSQQFYEVQWGIDHGEGTLPFTCSDIRNTPSPVLGSSVVLLTNAAPPYDRMPVSYYLDCDDRWTCDGSGGLPCNMVGTTASTVPIGTSIIEADLIGANGALLSSASIDAANASYYSIYSCDYTIAPFVFTIAP